MPTSSPCCFDDDNDAPFTPEAFPGLSPEACQFLNTPLEECDPDIACLLLALLAQHLADTLPPALGLGDPAAVFAKMRDRLGGLLGEATLADVLAVAPGEAPDRPGAPMTEPSVETPDSPPEAAVGQPDSAATTPAATAQAATDAAASPRSPAASQTPGPPAATAAIGGTRNLGALAAAPLSTSLPFSAREAAGISRRRRDAPSHRRRSRRRDSPARLRRRGSLPSCATDGPPAVPPRRLCYAACAGPP